MRREKERKIETKKIRKEEGMYKRKKKDGNK
jgi:hypothetical protein